MCDRWWKWHDVAFFSLLIHTKSVIVNKSWRDINEDDDHAPGKFFLKVIQLINGIMVTRMISPLKAFKSQSNSVCVCLCVYIFDSVL